MEAHARAPEPLTKTNDMTKAWRSWREDFLIFMKLTGYINKPDDMKANLLKNRIGMIGLEAINSFSFAQSCDKENMDVLLTKLDAHFDPPKNEIRERNNFFMSSRKPNESIDNYVDRLKEKAKYCNFRDLTSSLIRDKIIYNTHNGVLRTKYLNTEDLDLPKLVELCKQHESAVKDKTSPSTSNGGVPDKTEDLPRSKSPVSMFNTSKPCWRCNQKHAVRHCPAWGSQCVICGDKHHFSHCCKNYANMHNRSKELGNF